MKQEGFTLVELLVVILIMGILLTIGTVSLRNGQIDSRDKERSSDTDNIMRSLENIYTRNVGEYPLTTDVATAAAVQTTFSDLNKNSHRAPGVSSGTSIVPATNATATASGVTPQPSLTQYVYQPLASDGTLCNVASKECRSYVVYYRDERTDSVIMKRGKYQ